MSNEGMRRITPPKTKSTRPDALRKRAELIDAASRLFNEAGYDGASIDALIKRTGVSKATVYSHFGDKQGLFIAVMDALMERHLWPMEHEDITELPLREQLVLIADRTLDVLLSEDGLGLVRTTFAQAKRFPGIARALYSHGLERATLDLESVLAPHTDEPLKKAEYFWAMLMHKYALEGYLGLHTPMTARQRRDHANVVSDHFLSAFIQSS